MERHAVYTGTRNIYDDMETAAKSLIGMTKVDKVHFLIEDDEFPNELPDLIELHNVSNQTFFKLGTPNMESEFSYMAMMRIALCHVLDESIHKVLSLDCDTIVMHDLSSLWNINIDDYYFSATPEWHKSKYGLLYCNHGVVLYNLDKMRDGKADECIEVLNKRKYSWVEQDVGNYLCQGRIHEMPCIYNMNYWTDKEGKSFPVFVKHYAGVKREDWHKELEAIYWRDMLWEDVMKLHKYRCES